MTLDPTSLLLATVVILVFYLWYRRHDPRLPPTPATPWPILGNLVHLEKNPRQQFLQWRKKFGDIYSLYFGQDLMVFLNGYNSIKEALVKNSNLSHDRPFVFYDAATGYPQQGLTFSSGPMWSEQRQVTVSILRSLGMGKNVMAEKIMANAERYVEALASLKGKPVNIKMMTNETVSNVICSLALGHTFNYDDALFQKAILSLKENSSDLGGGNLLNFFPILQYLPGDLFKAKRIKSRTRFIMDVFLERFIQQKGYDEYDENNTDNFIAAYIKEKNRKKKAGISTTMNDITLKKCVFDVFGAGTDTVATTLLWCVLFLLHNPDMQEKMYQEIEREVGTLHLPNMHHRSKLTYLNAFILETQRLASIAPFGLTLKTSAEIKLGDYTIPKGTNLVANIDSVLWDENIWGADAKSFRPERFIDNDGNLKQFEEFIPFSIGKRSCPGDGLAKMQLFLFFAAMIQRFKFVPVDPSALPPLKDEDELGITSAPIPYQLRALDRRVAI